MADDSVDRLFSRDGPTQTRAAMLKGFGLNPKPLSERQQSPGSTQRSLLPYQSEPRHLRHNLPALKVSV